MMAQNIKGLESLKIWQMAMDYAVDVCQNILPSLPSEEKWALNSQLRRAVQSIPANIAEGYGRYNFQDSIRFFYIARGSILETKAHLMLAYRLDYMDQDVHHQYQCRLDELGKMLNGYIAHLRKQKGLNKVSEAPGDTSTYGDGFDPHL
jgi:four helix bundle protein